MLSVVCGAKGIKAPFHRNAARRMSGGIRVFRAHVRIVSILVFLACFGFALLRCGVVGLVFLLSSPRVTVGLGQPHLCVCVPCVVCVSWRVCIVYGKCGLLLLLFLLFLLLLIAFFCWSACGVSRSSCSPGSPGPLVLIIWVRGALLCPLSGSSVLLLFLPLSTLPWRLVAPGGPP